MLSVVCIIGRSTSDQCAVPRVTLRRSCSGATFARDAACPYKLPRCRRRTSDHRDFGPYLTLASWRAALEAAGLRMVSVLRQDLICT